MTTSRLDSAAAARRALLLRRLAQQRTVPAPAASAPAAASGFSVAEQRMWRIHTIDPESVSHNLTLVLECRGAAIKAPQLVAGLEAVLAQAPVLSSVVAADDDGPRRVATEVVGRWLTPDTDWVLGAQADQGSVPAAVAAALARSPFDLTREAPVRARIQQTDSNTVTVVLGFHHLALDDTSWPLLLGSVLGGEWLDGLVVSAPASSAAAGDALAAAVAHARSTWAADDVRYPISGNLPAISAEESWLNPLDETVGQQLRIDLDATDLAAFTAYAPTAGGTGNAALIVLCALAVTVVTGATDHVLLVPADNRRADQTPDTTGYCGNIVPIRFTFDPAATVGNAVAGGLASVYAAMSHSSVDYGPILTALRGSGGRFPVAEILTSVRNAPMRGVRVPAGINVDCHSVSSGVAAYPLSLAIELADADRAHLEVDYQPTTGETLIDQLADLVPALLHAIPTNTDRLLSDLLAEHSLPND